MYKLKLTKEQQHAVKTLYNRFKRQLNDISYLNFRRRVKRVIGLNLEYDTKMIHIPEIHMYFGIEIDGYIHT